MTSSTNENRPGAPAPGRPAAEEPNFRRAASRFMNDEDGQSMVEFAMSGFLMFALVLLTFQMSMNANASHYMNLGNFYALRTASVSVEYNQVGFSSYSDLPGDMIVSARYWMWPAWHYQGDLVLTALASGVGSDLGLPGAVTNVGMDPSDIVQQQGTGANTDWIESRLRFNYAMTVPLARNIIGAAWITQDYTDGSYGYNVDERIWGFVDSGHRGQMHGQSGIFMVNDQDFLLGETYNQLNAIAADNNAPFSAGTPFGAPEDSPGIANKLVTLQMTSDARQEADGSGTYAQYGDFNGNFNQPNMHRMIIHQRRF